MIIKPYSTVTEETFYPSDYPALAHWFPCTPDIGTDRLTDYITGLTLTDGTTDNTLITQNATISTCVTLPTARTAVVGGTLVSPNTKAVVYIATGCPSTTSSTYTIGGLSTGLSGFTMTGVSTYLPKVNTGLSAAINGTAGIAGNATPTLHTRALCLVFGSTIEQVDYDGTTYTDNRATVSLATMTSMPSITQAVSIGLNSNPSNLQVWYFDSLPNDVELKSAILWTHESSRLGNKNPYPGWKGKV